MRPFFVVLCLLVLGFVSAAAAETQFAPIDFPNTAPGLTQPSGINDVGDVVGSYRTSAGPTSPVHGFLLHDGSYMTIDDPSADGVTAALGINAMGDIVGLFRDGAGTHGFLLHLGKYTTIDFPGASSFTSAAAINAQGVIVGRYQDAGGALHGFSLIDGHYNKIDVPDAAGSTNVFGINDRGERVGSYGDMANMHIYGFIQRQNGSIEKIDAPKAAGLTVATGIAHNDVVGYYADRTGALHGFLLRNGQYATIDGPTGGATQAFAINGHADIVGMHSSQKQGFLLAGTAAPPDPDELKNANVACVALRRKIGSTTFARAYRTLGRCSFDLTPLEQLNIAGARASCTVEQNDIDFAAGHDGKTFENLYGTVESSFGNCVLAGTTANSAAEQRARANPSHTCGSVRSQVDPRAFSQLYGSLGKCISKMASIRTEIELKAASSCQTEQGKRGKAFAGVYGTFGACTAAKANAITAAQNRATVLAATKCLREQKTNPAAFKSKYGPFARCVARRA